MTDLVEMFRWFARQDFAGSSPTYERLALAIADRPELAVPLRAAPPGQQRAILYFAAARYLLTAPATGHADAGQQAGHPLAGAAAGHPVAGQAAGHPLAGAAAGHPLAAYLDGSVQDDGLVEAFADLVKTHGDALARLCATRTTQTNEPARAALLWPALGHVARLAGAPLDLIELGTSAGLLLLPDRYAYRYGHSRQGREDAPAVLTFHCERRGRTPDSDDPVIAGRTGIDLSPIRPGDTDAVAWLRACIWPEHTERLARLDAALAEAAAVGPLLVAGDMIEALPAAVAAARVPCVFTSHALTYLSVEDRTRLVATLDRLGAERDLYVVVNEAPACGLGLFGPAPTMPGTAIGLVSYRSGRRDVTLLGEGGPHGTWLDWH